MIAADNSNSFLIYALAKEFEKMGDTDQAIATFERLKSQDPEYNGLYYQLARLYQESDKLPAALKTCDEGIIICQSQKDLHALSELKNLRMNMELE